jgi:tRNA(Ile)-lysidine synthase
MAGLKGMSYRSIIKTFDSEIPVVRPLLSMWRDETVVYCSANGLRPHYDSSNDSLNFQRNRIRHLLIPSLENYNPKFRDAVLRMSQSLKGDYSFMMEMLEAAWQETVTAMDEGVITFDFQLLSQRSLGLQRNLIKQAMQTLIPDIDVNFSALERATNLIRDTDSSSVDLKGGLRLFREAGSVHIYRSNAALPLNTWPQMPSAAPLMVSIPGQTRLAGGWKLSCERWHLQALVREQAENNEDPFQVWLDAEKIPESLELRVRRQGDSFAPLGLSGHTQKLSDFFVNEKVPQRAREHWPLLCAGDEIIWVPGYRPAHPYRLTVSTKSAVYFSVSVPPEKNLE